MTVTGTVFELLTTANPRLNLDKQAFGPVTKNSNYEPLKEPRVHRWSDFTFQNISAAYGHLFNIGPVHSVADPQMRRTPTEIANEAQVDVLLSKWNQEICREPIKSAGMRVQNDLQQTTYDITMKYQGPA